MKTFAIIDGTILYIRKFEESTEAVTWAQNHCDCSNEIIVREITVINNPNKND